jgi:hypothetical protein
VSWKTLGEVAPTALVDARLQLHHAAQLVASAGLTFLEPQPDDSHPNLGWAEPLGALLGRMLPGAEGHVGLRVADLALIRVDAEGRLADEFPLDGRTVDDGYAWLASSTVGARADLPDARITRPSYDIPPHAVADGAAFSGAARDALTELSRWFANGHHALEELAARTPGASEVRCWPHHFDVGFIEAVATQPDGSLAKSIGVGLSPGDESYAEPYAYVSPWPYPEPGGLPPLDGGGRWHTAGFTSAVLTGTMLLEGARAQQAKRFHGFLDGAVDASRRVLAV